MTWENFREPFDPSSKSTPRLLAPVAALGAALALWLWTTRFEAETRGLDRAAEFTPRRMVGLTAAAYRSLLENREH